MTSRTNPPRPARRVGHLVVLAATALAAAAVPVGAGASLPDPGGAAVAERRASPQPIDAVTLQVLPPLAQPGADAADADEARTVVLARVTPARSGVAVLLQGRGRGGWRDLGYRYTDADGFVESTVPARAAYRARAGERVSAADRPDRWRLDFSDDFDRTGLGPRWDHRGGDYNPQGKRVCSKGDPRAVGMPGETLRLWVRRDPDRDDRCGALRQGRIEGPFAYRLNGHVSTEYSYTFTFGVAAARMKFQPEAGQHASFWMQPKSPPAPGGWGPRFTGAEIDIIEYFGRKPTNSGLAQFTYHNDDVGNRVKTGGVLEGAGRFLTSSSDSWTERYHVFSVEWTPQEYVFRIDGKVTWRSSDGISHRPQFLILSLLSSDYEIAAAGDEGLGTQFAEVDWVRVWQQ